MRAILIDPFSCTVTETEHDGNYRSIYRAISHETNPVERFDAVVRLDDGDAIFVDDDGLLKEPTRLFALKDGVQPYAGKGLVLGSDAEGETVGAKVSLGWVKDQVIFLVAVNGQLFVNSLPWEANEEWSLILEWSLI